MIVIIAGGRDVISMDVLKKAISDSGFSITQVVSGGCRGADRLGERWADAHGIPCTVMPAHWSAEGRSAGPRRNARMASVADALIAIDNGGPGTRNMITTARRLGLAVHVHRIKSR